MAEGNAANSAPVSAPQHIRQIRRQAGDPSGPVPDSDRPTAVARSPRLTAGRLQDRPQATCQVNWSACNSYTAHSSQGRQIDRRIRQNLQSTPHQLPMMTPSAWENTQMIRLLVLACLLVCSSAGCQCCRVTEPYGDLIDCHADKQLCLDRFYHPALDATRWCNRRCGWGCRLIHRRTCEVCQVETHVESTAETRGPC